MTATTADTPTVAAASELLSSARLLLTLAKAMARVQRERVRPRSKAPLHRV